MKRNSKAAANLGKAQAILADFNSHLYALANFGEQGAKLALDVYATRYAIDGICNQIRAGYREAISLIPAEHPAVARINGAIEALDHLCAFMKMAEASETANRKLIGQVIIAMVGKSGREMERAEQALGERPTCGYLSGYLLEVEDMQQIVGTEAELLHMFRTTKDQQLVLEFAKTAKQQSPK
jgi:hypothetical protein